MYSENVLRRLPCYHCVHCADRKGLKGRVFTQRRCALTNRWGNMNKAFYCTKFENVLEESSTREVNGYRIKKDQVEDYRTAKQWADDGYRVMPGIEGTKMYATRMAAMHDGPVFTYYLPDQVEKL